MSNGVNMKILVLGASGMFPPMVTQMVAVGEETGNLDAMLSKIADFYDTEVDYLLSSLTSMLEPIMIVGMGGIVGFIVISVFLPLYQLVGSMAQAFFQKSVYVPMNFIGIFKAREVGKIL